MSLSKRTREMIQREINSLKHFLKFAIEDIKVYKKRIISKESEIPNLEKQIAELEKDLEK